MRSPTWTLKGRLAKAFVAVGLVVVLLVVFALLLIVRLGRQQDLVMNRYFEIYRLSTDSLAELVDAETAVRGFALTGREDFLEPYLTADLPGQSDRLLGLLSDDEQLAAELALVDEAARRWDTQFAEGLVADVRAGGPGAVDTARLEQGRALFEELRVRHARYLDTILEQRADALADAQRGLRLLLAALLVGGLGVVVAAVALRLALSRWVTGPLDDLAAETRVVASGSLDHQLRVQGPREIRFLAADVEEMRQRLVAQLATVERSRADVEAAREQVAAQAEVLRDQAEELRRSNRDLEQFAYVASHDLQEPLRKVASFCQLLERRYKGQLDERADTYISFAVDGATRMQALINDLLAFSRVGRVGWQPAPVDLDGVLARALSVLEDRLAESDAEVDADPLPTVVGQDSLLVQLFQNLLGNAVKFRRPDVAPRVRITCHRAGEEWHLAFADNGIGIEPRYAERVFVIFQRLHGRDAYTGTGIGLALCKKIVEQHGGRIWVDTHRTDGTTIHVALPVEAPGPAPGTPRTLAEERV